MQQSSTPYPPVNTNVPDTILRQKAVDKAIKFMEQRIGGNVKDSIENFKTLYEEIYQFIANKTEQK